MSKNIQSLLDTTNNYIKSIDKSGIMDPFNYFDIVTTYWVGEPNARHLEFVNDVRDAFGTTAYIPVSIQLSKYLHTGALAAITRLVELDSPITIIENAINHEAKLRNGQYNAHLLVVMLITSLNICNS